MSQYHLEIIYIDLLPGDLKCYFYHANHSEFCFFSRFYKFYIDRHAGFLLFHSFTDCAFQHISMSNKGAPLNFSLFKTFLFKNVYISGISLGLLCHVIKLYLASHIEDSIVIYIGNELKI